MQIGPKIRLDSHTLGNLVKNVAPAAAFIPGVGVIGAGVLGALGGLARGENIKKAAFSGVSNAALGGGLASIGGKLGVGTGAHLGLGFGDAVAPTPAVNTGAVPGPSSMASGLSRAVTAPSAGLASEAVGATPGNLAGQALHAGGGLLDFAEAHPNAAAGVLQGLGGIATSGAENRLRNAQATNLEQQAGETQYAFEQRKRREAQYAPIWSALSGPGGFATAARNPYASVGA